VAGDQRKFQVAMMHADRFSQEGKWSEALRAYRFALAEFSNNAAAINGFGKASLALGQIEVADKAFRQALKINPTNMEALNHMADIQERMGQLDAAAETYLRIGTVYASQQNLDDAIDYWTRATRLTSGLTSAHRKLADALVEQDKPRLAVRQFLTVAAIYQRQADVDRMHKFIDRAGELLPDDPGVLAAIEAADSGKTIRPEKVGEAPPEIKVVPEFSTGELRDEQPFELEDLFAGGDDERSKRYTGGLINGFQKRALEELANLIFEDSDNPGAMFVMQGVDLQSRNDFMGAANLYKQAVAAGGSVPASLYYNLGLLYREQGLLNNAVEALEAAVEDPQYGASAYFAIGETYALTNDLPVAIRYFVNSLYVIDMQTVSGYRSYELAQSYENYSETYVANNDPAQIKRFIDSLRSFFANSDWEQRVYEARQRMNSLADDEHTMCLAEFLETPETEIMVTTLAETSEYIRLNLLMTASEECLRAIQKVPSFLPLHARLADIMLKQNRTDDAITKYLYIARVYQMRSQPEQTVSVYQKILKLAPMDVTVRAKMIDIHTSQQNMTEALNQYLILADSYYQLAQVDRAIEKYNEAVRIAANVEGGVRWQKDALTRVADIYNQRFDWARSARALEQLYELDKDDLKVKQKLVELYFKQSKVPQAIRLLDDLLSIYQRRNPVASLELLKDLVFSYPKDVDLRQRLAVAYIQNNMQREAIAEYDALGEMQLERGLREQAIQTIQSIINLGPTDIEGYKQLLVQIGGRAN
jgi:tetratricopeptide (TPR) repeat protein